VTNTYTYDPNGNRLTMNGGGEWFYDSQDRLLTTPDGTAFTYRNDGTATSKTNSTGTYAYNYDLSGFLQSVTLPTSGTSVQYAADAKQRRIAKSLTWGANTISQQFVYDDQLRVAAELSSNGSTVTSVFVYGTKPNVPDYMVSVANGGKVYRIISDWVGSVRLVLDTSVTPAAVVQQLDYDEFGNVLPSSFDTTCAPTAQCFPVQPFGFAGGLQDRDTGLVRFGARDYDPQVGRWVSKDPSRFWGGLNLYAYAANDPVNQIDPTGTNVYQGTVGVIPPAVQAALYGASAYFSGLTGNAWASGNYLQAAGDAAVTAATGLAGAALGFLTQAPMTGLDVELGALGMVGGAFQIGAVQGAISESLALENAEAWLGPGYTEVAPDVYRSADGLRQFRMTGLDKNPPYVNFEALENGATTENNHVTVCK
jgi:RHS repeat-associated protein